MKKDLESKRKFEKLKKQDSNRQEGVKRKPAEEKKVDRNSNKRVVPDPQSDSDVTFRKDEVQKFEDDLQLEDFNFESTRRDKSTDLKVISV